MDIGKLNLTEDTKAHILTRFLQLPWRAWCSTLQIYCFVRSEEKEELRKNMH
jgi:hypothetical protein